MRRSRPVVIAIALICIGVALWIPNVPAPDANNETGDGNSKYVASEHEAYHPPPSKIAESSIRVSVDGSPVPPPPNAPVSSRVVVEFRDPDYRQASLMRGALLDENGAELARGGIDNTGNSAVIDFGARPAGIYWFKPLCGEMTRFEHSGESRVLVELGALVVRVSVVGPTYALMEDVDLRICDKHGVGTGDIINVRSGVIFLPKAAIGEQVISAMSEGYAECDPVLVQRDIQLKLHLSAVSLTGQLRREGEPLRRSASIQIGRSKIEYDFRGNRKPTRRVTEVEGDGLFRFHHLRGGVVYPLYARVDESVSLIGYVAADASGMFQKLNVHENGSYETVPTKAGASLVFDM